MKFRQLAAIIVVVAMGVLMVHMTARATNVSWGYLKCIYSGKTAAECGGQPSTIPADDKNAG